jgi:excisionase family DNA binding protein
MAKKMDETPAGERLAYTISETAALVGISRSSIYRQMAAGELASCKFGKTRRIPAAALRAWLANAPSA